MGVPLFFQAQKGCSMDLVSGQQAVAHWMRPLAFSMALADIATPLIKSSKTAATLTCFGAAIWTRGIEGWITNPNQAFHHSSSPTIRPQVGQFGTANLGAGL